MLTNVFGFRPGAHVAVHGRALVEPFVKFLDAKDIYHQPARFSVEQADYAHLSAFIPSEHIDAARAWLNERGKEWSFDGEAFRPAQQEPATP